MTSQTPSTDELIKKGTLLLVKHSRKGTFYGRVKRDFSIKEEWYPIVSDEIRSIDGLNTEWEYGEEVPCRNSLCKIEIVQEISKIKQAIGDGK